MYKSSNISLKAPSSSGAERYYSVFIKDMLNVEPAEFELKGELIAISLSGDSFLSFRRKLLKHGVIDTKYRWLLKNAHLVILVSHLEMDHIVDCLWLIYSLEDKARRKGGYVHLITDKSFVFDFHFQWKSQHPVYATKGVDSNVGNTALFQGNLEIWNWLKTKNVMERVGNFLFIHGGISRELLDLKLSIREVNALVRSHMGTKMVPGASNEIHLLLNSSYSDQMYSDGFLSEESRDLADSGLRYYKVSGIIYGNPTKDSIAMFHNDAIISIGTTRLKQEEHKLKLPILKYTKNGLEVREVE